VVKQPRQTGAISVCA